VFVEHRFARSGRGCAVRRVERRSDRDGGPHPVGDELGGRPVDQCPDIGVSEATFPVTADPDLTSCVKPGPSGTAARRAAVVAAAEKWKGTRYSYGGGNACGQTVGQNGLVGFDCSGLMTYAFAQVGFALPHLTYSQVGYGTAVTSTSAPQPGDLVFYNGNSHVGVYVGNGQVMQALGASWGVNIWSLTFAGSISAMRRLIP